MHGFWWNIVEIELSVLVRQCLKRRLPDVETLRREARAWEEERNRVGASVEWRFATDGARTKLRKPIRLLSLDQGLEAVREGSGTGESPEH